MEPCDGSRCRSEPCGCAELPVVPKPEQPFIEKVLKRVGNAAKTIAFVTTLHKSLGRLPPQKAMAMYTTATWLSVYKVLTDHQEPYGSRRYIAHLAGDDQAIRDVRDLGPGEGVLWEHCVKVFGIDTSKGMLHGWSTKAVTCAWYTMWRNRWTLSVFWGYSLFGKVLKMQRMKGPPVGLVKGLFPEGFGTFLIACSRTSTLLASYAFMFWTLVGLGASTRPTDKGFTKMQATNFITVAAIVGLYVEDKKRWQSMGAFMAMSVFD